MWPMQTKCSDQDAHVAETLFDGYIAIDHCQGLPIVINILADNL